MLILNTKSDWEISVSRKILKIIISLLFLAVAAVAAVLGITSFFPDLFTTPKYGTKPVSENSARKTPAFKKDKQEEKNNEEPMPVYRQIPDDMTDKYGVAPVNNIRFDISSGPSKYGVMPVKRSQESTNVKLVPSSIQYRGKIGEAKYGVAPVQIPSRDMMSKYGVAPVRDSMKGKYGVAPVEED